MSTGIDELNVEKAMTKIYHSKVFRMFLSGALGLTIVLSGSGSTLARPGKDWKATALAPQSIHHVAAAKTSAGDEVSVIVQLEDPALASYAGGIQGLRATSPRATGASTLNVRSADSQAYLGHLARKQSDFEARARSAVSRMEVKHRLNVVVNAVAVVVPADQVTNLTKIAGVKAVLRDELLKPDTDRSPEFIQADAQWNRLGGPERAGEGVIVGVLDTGIWPEHPSLSDPDPVGKPYPAPPPPTSGTRGCQFSGGSNPGAPFTCNNKLIGAERFMAMYDRVIGLLPTEFTSARDDDGHGTHTSTTAAGNWGVNAQVFDVPRGGVSGIAPRAHVIMYKVCGEQGCFGSDSAAAIQKAIQDGVNAINFSISGGNNPYEDVVELAFLDAYNAGVFVSASAGNSGPAADTVAHRGPWVATVAASTTDRQFTSTVTLRASNGDALNLTGASITDGITTPTPVVLPATGLELCGSTPDVNPFPPGTFNGEIVVCARGITARVVKGFNVMEGGGGGMLLYNPTLAGIATDNHWLPAVHFENDAGTQLRNFLANHTGVTATFSGGARAAEQGDKMAVFSSRGGAGQTLGISKPDVTAPGVQILAGQSAEPATITGGPHGELFMVIQGTSMSSPHNAGAAALIKNEHPTWSPGQIKSALMTTATSRVVKEDGTTPATPFDHGSGRINLATAGDPGLTFDETGANYRALQNQLWNANYPSVFVPVMPGIITVQRTAHSVLDKESQWDLRVKEKPGDLSITVDTHQDPTAPDRFIVGAGGDHTFDITIDARNVPLGQVRHAVLELNDQSGKRQLRMPITIVRRQSVVPFTKTCSPASFALGATSNCTILATNMNLDTAMVEITDEVPNRLEVVRGSVVGATQDPLNGNKLSFAGSLAGAQPPNVVIGPGSSPPGAYLPLSSLGVPPIAGMGDDTLVNFNVPAFTFAGNTYTSLGVVSNGYLVVGGGTAQDIEINNQRFPDPARPNNVLAPFWTDLNPAAGGAVRIATITDGVDTWIVVDYDAVPEFSTPRANTFEVWIGINRAGGRGEDISYVFGPIEGNGDLGFLTVGAENLFGNRGQNSYVKTPTFGPEGTLPTNSTQLRVTGTPGAPGASHTITFTVRGVSVGGWTNHALMTSNVFQGTSVAAFGGTVTR